MQEESTREECRQRQEDEIVALDSIFAATDHDEGREAACRPEEVRVKLLQRVPEPVLEFHLPIILPRPTRIVVNVYAPEQEVVSTPGPSSEPLMQSSAREGFRSGNGVESALSDAHPQSRHRGRKNKVGPAGHLNAAAHTFQPSKVASTNTSVFTQPKTFAVHADPIPAEAATVAIERPSLGPTNDHDIQGRSVAQQESSRQRSTKQLPALTHLAPIKLRVRLPSTYPAEQPPIIDSLTAPWLPSDSNSESASHSWLRQKLDEQYREFDGLEVLYIWATFLSESLWVQLLEEPFTSDPSPPFLQESRKNDRIEACLRFAEHLDTLNAQPRLAAQLVAHSRLCSRTTFDAASFDCAICLETRKGRACTRLTGCGHVFCSECLAGYLSSLVDDGFHRQAKRCPDPECVTMWSEREKQNLVDQEGNLIAPAKVKSADVTASDLHLDADSDKVKSVIGLVTREELEYILGPARLTRLDQLAIKAKMEADPSVSYCPRSGCQAAVVRLSSDDNSGHWERFRECLSCGFAFCAWCSRSWHGPTPCPVSFQSELIRQYLSLAPSSPDRLIMEQKFGRKTLEIMVRKYEEEQQTQQWLSDYTTPCPTCGIAIEKSYGCNHMTCKSCQTHYCYLCGMAISKQNPYQHFNTVGYECYHRLFDGLLGDQDPRHQQQREQQQQDGRGGEGDGRPGFALLLDENGIPLHLEPEDQEMDLLAWQQLG